MSGFVWDTEQSVPLNHNYERHDTRLDELQNSLLTVLLDLLMKF